MNKIATKMAIPNYRPQDNKLLSCESCLASQKYPNASLYCTKFKASVSEKFTCDAFVPSATKTSSAPILGGRFG